MFNDIFKVLYRAWRVFLGSIDTTTDVVVARLDLWMPVYGLVLVLNITGSCTVAQRKI